MTRRLTCAALLIKNGWIDRPVIVLDAEGCIHSIEPRGAATSGPLEDLGGYVVPGFANAHSHAFQYAMAGLAEHLPADLAGAKDDFWSWREAMYGLARRIAPEQMEAIAACVYAEMLRHGITAVAEFHYLHHAPDGTHYVRQAEMGARLIAGARTAGIHLTLIPVLYAQGGFGKPARPAQARFLSQNLAAYHALVDDTQKAAHGTPDVIIGRGVHSLRAVQEKDVKALFAEPFAGPLHLHIAEQQQEVDDCLAHLKKRPVAWLLDEVEVDARLSLVHATHMTDDETTRLAKTGATVVLCPSTEGNLGDGLFPLQLYAASGGAYTIGTDSHIGLSPLEELRWLDYAQRLRAEKRNILCEKPGDDSGAKLFQDVWTAGRQALGRAKAGFNDYFAIGQTFDALVLDGDHPAFYGKAAAHRLSAFLYAGDSSVIRRVLRRGVDLVRDGRHVRADAIMRTYRDQMSRT